MTKKDYEAMAGLIKYRFDAHDKLRARRGHEGDYQIGYDAGQIAAIENLAIDMADHFEMDNPRFDRERFLDACGL